MLALAAILSLVPALHAQESGLGGDPTTSADQLVHQVIQNELKDQTGDHSRWRFRETDDEGGKEKTSEIVRTRYGDLSRLLALDGRPLTSDQAHAEDNRIRKLIADPNDVRKDLRDRHEDYEKERRLLGLFPVAFRYTYDGEQDGLTRLAFTPNPDFHPDRRQGQVFHHLTGTILIDRQHMRLAGIDGTLTTEVEFAGGLLGHLDRGGTFSVRMKDVGEGHWRLTRLTVHMNGKALLFKTIAIKEDETYSDYRAIPSDMTLPQAAELLEKEPIVSQLTQPPAR